MDGGGLSSGSDDIRGGQRRGGSNDLVEQAAKSGAVRFEFEVTESVKKWRSGLTSEHCGRALA